MPPIEFYHKNFIQQALVSIFKINFFWLCADKVYPKQAQYDNTHGLPKGYHCYLGKTTISFLTNHSQTPSEHYRSHQDVPNK